MNVDSTVPTSGATAAQPNASMARMASESPRLIAISAIEAGFFNQRWFR